MAVRLGMKNRHRFKPVVILLIFIITITWCCHIFLKRAEPSFIAQSSNYSNTAFTDLVNKCVIDITSTDEFSDFFEVISNNEHEITSIEANTSQINKITSKLMINIQNALNGDYPATIHIPLGSLTGYWMLSSMGPSIPVKITPISIVNSSFDEEFQSAGINQVKHKIYLHVTVDMLYSGYLLHETERIEVTVPIAETIIVGDVPQYYGGSYGIKNEIK